MNSEDSQTFVSLSGTGASSARWQGRQKKRALIDSMRLKWLESLPVQEKKASNALTYTQTEAFFRDETRVVSMLASHYRCPLCQSKANLWRIVEGGKPLFQVRCSQHFGKRCLQPPIPAEPVATSEGAVRAWCLSLELSKL